MISRLLLIRTAFWVCFAAVLYLSLTAAPQVSTAWDKSNHLLAFGVLAVLGAYSWPDRLGGVFVGLAAYGALIELMQAFTPDRQDDWVDIVADLLGLLIGWCAVRAIREVA